MRRLIILLAVALATGSCTPDDVRVAGPRATARAPSPSVTATSPSEGSEQPTAAPEDQEILRVAVPEPATLDPMLVQDPGSMLVARQLFEGLTRWNPVTRKVEPAAAESWKIRRGGRRFVFRLRDGMTFHDGSAVTANDFVFAFNRIARRSSASDLAYTLERVKGFVEVNQLGEGNRLPGLRSPNKRTLVIDLREPFYEFPVVLTHPGLVPVPRAAVRRLQVFVSEPVGNGPFRIAQPWVPGEEVVLSAFDGFWEPLGLDGIRFLPYEDAAASWLTFRDDGLDVSEVPVGQIEQAGDDYGTDAYLPLLNAAYYGVNLDDRKLRDREVRKAATIAIDRTAIAEKIYKGNMELPRGIVPPGMPGFDDDICRSLCEYGPDEAARMVAKLPKRKRRLTVEYTQGRPHSQVARAVRRDLQAAGFDVKLRSFGFLKYLKRLRDGRHGIYRLGWIAEYPTPDVFLGSLFESDAPDNHSSYGSKRVDRLLRKARRTRDEVKRVSAYRKAEKLIMRGIPVIPIGTFEIRWAMQPRVKGLQFDVMGGFDAAGVSLANE